MSGQPYDSAPETLAHARRVGDFLALAAAEIVKRAAKHDHSKVCAPEKVVFDEMTPRLASLDYGSQEYLDSVKALGPALDHHFRENDHHPEHYADGVNGMSLLSMLEMLCDWRAASERVKQRLDDPEKVRTFEAGLAYNQERFGYSDEIAGLLLNTARELGMLEEQPESLAALTGRKQAVVAQPSIDAVRADQRARAAG